MRYLDTTTKQLYTFISLDKERETLVFRMGLSGGGRTVEMRERQFNLSLHYKRLISVN